MPSHVTEFLTIIEQDDEGVSERILNLLTEFIDFFMIIANKVDPSISSELVRLLIDMLFKVNICNRFMKCLADFEEVYTTSAGIIMTGYRLVVVLVSNSGTKKESLVSLYLKKMSEVFQNKATFCGKEDIMFRPEQRNAL